MRRIDPCYAMEQMVDLLTTKLLSDESLERFFEGVDMDQFESHQYRLLALTQMPSRFPEHILHKHHRLFATMGLTEQHFDRLLFHVQDTLDECGVHCDEVARVLSRLQPLRKVFQDGGSQFTKIDAITKSTVDDDIVDAAMESFAWHISEDEELSEILQGYDIEQIKEHQRKFLLLALQGFPETSNVQQYLRLKHNHLFARGLRVRHFDSLAARFLETVSLLRVEPNIVDKAKDFLKVARDAFMAHGAKKTDNTS